MVRSVLESGVLVTMPLFSSGVTMSESGPGRFRIELVFACWTKQEASEVLLEQKVGTTPKAMKDVFGGMPRSRIALETGMHSPSTMFPLFCHLWWPRSITRASGASSVAIGKALPVLLWDYGAGI